MMIKLDIRHVSWDKYRGAVIIPAGRDQVAISIEALESFANRKLTSDEAIEEAVQEKAMFSAIANATPAHDNIITITAGILSSRSWTAENHVDDGPEDSGPIYADESDAARGDYI